MNSYHHRVVENYWARAKKIEIELVFLQFEIMYAILY